MAASRRWLVSMAAVVAALVASALWVMGPGRAPAAPVPWVEHAQDPGIGTLEIADDAGEPSSAHTIAPASAEPALGEPDPSATSAPPVLAIESWTLWGHVLRAADGTPAPGLHFSVSDAHPVVSDEMGRFEIRLPIADRPRGSTAQIRVRHGSGAILLQEERVLEPGLELRVDDEIAWLRGRVVDALGAPLVTDGVAISCWLAEGYGRFLGHQTAGKADGAFHIAAPRSALRCDSVTVLVALRQTRFPSRTTLAALQSEEGATVVLDVCPLRIELRAAAGGELVQPELRVVAWRPGAERAEVFSYPELDASGDAELFVERGVERIEIGAGAAGCAPWIEQREAPRCGETLRLELQRLGPDDVLEGIVLDADGRPVERAFASCSPPARDDQSVAVPAIRGARTNPAGRFSLPFPAGRTASVMAYHRDHGSTGKELVQGGRRDLVLRFLPVARLDVTVTTPEGESPRGDPMRFALGLADGTWELDHGWRGWISFEEVPAGSHRLLCVSGDGRWWGLFPVEVFDTGPRELRHTLAPAHWVEGRLVDAAGAPLGGVDVRRVDAPVDPGEGWNPFRAASDSEGRFRVLLGSASEGELAFARDGVELGRGRFAAGDAGDRRPPALR